jgi:hypothetical protein
VRAAPCHLLVPGVTTRKDRIHVNDNPAIVEQAVVDTLAYRESGLFHRAASRIRKIGMYLL